MIEDSTEKQLIVVGGPNGSGKTTLAVEIVAEKEVIYIGADNIAYESSANATGVQTSLRVCPHIMWLFRQLLNDPGKLGQNC